MASVACALTAVPPLLFSIFLLLVFWPKESPTTTLDFRLPTILPFFGATRKNQPFATSVCEFLICQSHFHRVDYSQGARAEKLGPPLGLVALATRRSSKLEGPKTLLRKIRGKSQVASAQAFVYNCWIRIIPPFLAPKSGRYS